MKDTRLITFFTILHLSFKVNSLLSKRVTFKDPTNPQSEYIIGYDVNYETGEIIFDLEMETTGYVGLGVSRDGKMNGADIFIGGVYSDGIVYRGDYHGTGHTVPTLDEQQDWNLLEAEENATFTRLLFTRKFNTCDEDGDVPIIRGLNRFIWAVGETDQLQHHYLRGEFQIYISQDIPDQCNPSEETTTPPPELTSENDVTLEVTSDVTATTPEQGSSQSTASSQTGATSEAITTNAPSTTPEDGGSGGGGGGSDSLQFNKLTFILIAMIYLVFVH